MPKYVKNMCHCRVGNGASVLDSKEDGQGWTCKVCLQHFKQRHSNEAMVNELRQHAAGANHIRAFQVIKSAML